MADPTYSLGVQPKWYLVDDVGRPTAGFMYTYSNLNPTEYKPVYQDNAGNFPYPQPVPFAENGTAGPIYFKFDSDDPEDLYYLRFYDENNNFLYDVQNFTGETGGGGGSVTTAINLKNYVGNNVYQYNTGTSATPVPNNTILAPSSNIDFIDPDIRFFNGTVGGTDTISFPEFTFGINSLTPDTTPQYYLHYDCTVSGAESLKYIQFPIQPKVTTLDNQVITVNLWARVTGGLGDTITVRSKQFFGTPTPLVTPSVDLFTVIGAPITLDGNWTQYSVSGTIPGVSGKTISPTGDDALYLTIELPHATTATIDITKVSMYLGTSAPENDFNSLQQIEAILDTPRTGDIRSGLAYASYVPGGWVSLQDGTIGPATATPGGPTIIRNNADTWFLYSLIWNGINNTNCPIYTSAGVASTRGASAAADWEANKRIALPSGTGRVVSNTSGSHLIGSSDGADTVSLTGTQNGSHTHSATTTIGGENGNLLYNDGVSSPNSFSYTNISAVNHRGGSVSASTSLATSGTGAPHNNIQPTVYIPTIIKL